MNEKTLRRQAASQGYKLIKSRARSAERPDYGLYALVDTATRGTINPSLAGYYPCSWTLEDVSEYLSG